MHPSWSHSERWRHSEQKVFIYSVNVLVRAIDLTKAYDKVNHNSLFMKLMKRHIPLYTTVGATRELAFGLARLR